MKYESTILKRLIDTYGVVGNPRYISEIIKEFIVRGKECFPNLFTYQADWLAHIDEFGLNPTYTVSYTGQSIYAPNTLERPVKSAILSGQTLVNLCQFKSTNTTTSNTTYEYNDNKYIVTNNGNDGYVKTDITVFLEANKTYTFKAKCDRGFNDSNGYIHLLLNNVASGAKKMVDGNTTFTVASSGIYYIRLDVRASYEPYIFSDLIILEGDYTNEDISYFEGMQSVQMPGLTTNNSNLAMPSDFERGYINESTGQNTSGYQEFCRTIGFIDVKGFVGRIYGGAKYNDTIRSVRLFGYDKDKKFVKTSVNSFDVTSDIWYIRANIHTPENPSNPTKLYNIYISSKNSYEPYKSNILTVNEDVELRGIGEVQDTLDCLTGEMTERIGEDVLDGSQGLTITGTPNQENTLCVLFPDFPKIGNGVVMSDELIKASNYDYSDTECITQNAFGIAIRLLRNRLESADINGVKKFLSQNPITVQYQLETESVKTVDLTILDQNGQNVKQLMSFNGGTHFNPASSEGSPLPTVSVSVETDLEETLMKCSLEGNTL